VKILQVLAGAKHGGAETAFVDMCLALSEAGEDIEVATRPNPIRVPRLEEAGIKVHKLPFGGVPDIYTPFKLKKIIKEFQPHIVQTWMSRASQKTPRWNKDKSISPYLVVSRLGGYYKLKHFKSSDYFVTITPDIKRFLVASGVEENNVRHINNFAEIEDVQAPLSREFYDTPKDAVLLLGLGRLHSAKAFDTLMKSIVNLKDVYLWIAGEGPDRETLQDTCIQLGLEKRVKFLGWVEDRAALFDAADICVFSSRYEPFGTVFVQAWAQKTPLITTDADGPRQFVRNKEDGLMVPVDDVSAMEKAIILLKEDKKLRKRLVFNGFDRYQSEFTKEKCVNAYLSYYFEILKKENILK
jgi:glycosyltransferase involved in cell wall biosynthesis